MAWQSPFSLTFFVCLDLYREYPRRLKATEMPLPSPGRVDLACLSRYDLIKYSLFSLFLSENPAQSLDKCSLAFLSA